MLGCLYTFSAGFAIKTFSTAIAKFVVLLLHKLFNYMANAGAFQAPRPQRQQAQRSLAAVFLKYK
jgi:hypothetical protein